MSETYTKLFGSITRSSVWLEDDQTLRVWFTLLALADRNGYVGASLGGLAATARVSVEKTQEALKKFLEPDPDSRSPEFEGRRIQKVDRGWELLNYERFRDMRDEEARKEYERNRKRMARAKSRLAVPDSPELSRDVPDSPELSVVSAPHRHRQIIGRSDSEAEAEKRKQEKNEITTGPARKARTRVTKHAAVVIDSEDRSAIWRMYAAAYQSRYGVAPVRNAKVNAQLAQLSARLPLEDMAHTIQHYCGSQNARYVAAGHSVGCLLQDAEKLRTEALTGRNGTASGAMRADKLVDRQQHNAGLLEMAREFAIERKARLDNGK